MYDDNEIPYFCPYCGREEVFCECPDDEDDDDEEYEDGEIVC